MKKVEIVGFGELAGRKLIGQIKAKTISLVYVAVKGYPQMIFPLDRRGLELESNWPHKGWKIIPSHWRQITAEAEEARQQAEREATRKAARDRLKGGLGTDQTAGDKTT